MPDVFVLHANEESARPVAESLEAAGFSVWLKADRVREEHPLGHARLALESAKAVVVLWSAESVASHSVREAAAYGRERDILVPVIVDDCTVPPTGFRLIPSVRLHHWDGNRGDPEWRKVIDAVQRLVNSSGDTAGPALPTPRHDDGGDGQRTPDQSILTRLRSRFEGVKQAVSYGTAIVTVFKAAAGWKDSVDLVADHPVVALICLIALAALFGSTLIQNVRLGLLRLTPFQREAPPDQRRQVSEHAQPQRRLRRNRAVLIAGSFVTALALGLVIALLYVSTTGVHYVLLESATTYERAVERADEINRVFERGGERVRVRPQRPHFDNPNCAILVGPYFDQSEAIETLKRLKRNPEFGIRQDATLLPYYIGDVKEALARFLGWKITRPRSVGP